MPRTCTVCAHPKRDEIEGQLVSQVGYRDIARQFSVSKDALARHMADHLPEALLRAQEAQGEAEAINVLRELSRCAARLNLLFDACDKWLRDANNPNRYDIGPRAEEIFVTYLEKGDDGRKIRKKAKLSDLLAKIDKQHEVVSSETKHADPRELVLKTYDRIESLLTLIAKLIGQLDERPQVNVLLSPEWAVIRSYLVESLEDFPDARAAAAGAILALEANEYRH
jgi:ATP-dependent exoDNAse (exonuclease V) beta subunit